MGFKITRPDEKVFFESWREYLRERGTDLTFCSVLATNTQAVLKEALDQIAKTEEFIESDSAAGDARDLQLDKQAEKRRLAPGLNGFAWLTPMLGSGCLATTDGKATDRIATMPGRIANNFDEHAMLPDGTPTKFAVQAFAQELIEARVPVAPGTSQSRDALEASSPGTALATECAYLMSRLYFSAGSTLRGPLPAGDEPLQLNLQDPRSPEIIDSLVNPLSAALEDLRNSSDGDSDLEFVRKFVALLLADLRTTPTNGPLVRATDVALMSEIAWHFMTRETAQYASWTELLFLLSLKSEVADRTKRWPFISDLGGARRWLREGLSGATDASWRNRSNADESETTERDRLYDAVADVLIAQAKLRSGGKSLGQKSYPPAVAYVTSFDVELEMALLARNSPVLLVVPFEVYRKGDDNATIVWLQAVVNESGDGGLDDLCGPLDWRLLDKELTSSRQDDETHDADVMPVVVRLAGSPLAADPDPATYAVGTTFWNQLRNRLGVKDRPSLSLETTVLLDENTALQQWAADLRTWLEASNRVNGLGLPNSFLDAADPVRARFWLLLGVQLSDSAVRQRSASIVGASALRGGIASTGVRPERTGVVVNRRSAAPERDVFHWLGMDVVEAQYKDVLSALEHHVLHLREPEKRRVVPGDQVCPIGEEVEAP